MRSRGMAAALMHGVCRSTLQLGVCDVTGCHRSPQTANRPSKILLAISWSVPAANRRDVVLPAPFAGVHDATWLSAASTSLYCVN